MILLVHVATAILLIIAYYHFFKIILRTPAYYFARFFQLTKKNTLEESKGAVGFILVVLSHAFFAVILFKLLHVNYQDLGFNFLSLKALFLSILLGAGLAGTAMIVCLFVVKLFAYLMALPEQQIMLALPGGWLKSYEYIKTIAPPSVFFLVLILQLTCEEIIFRGIFINYFISFGSLVAVLISTLLFSLMQIFLMPTIRGALFPVIGALLMGLVHGYLFLILHSIVPLVLSHIVFFMLFTI